MYLNLPLTSFWIFLSSLVLISHAALNKVVNHAYTELSYEMLMNVIRIDYFGIKQAFDDWLFGKYNFTSSQAYS